MIRATLLFSLLMLLLGCVASLARADTTIAQRVPPHIREGGETGHRLHFGLDTSFQFSIGGQMALGASVRGSGYAPIWNTRVATGTADVGVVLSYANEATALAPWLSGNDVTGAAHRIQLVASLGHTFHLGKRRRSSLGFHLYGGLNQWISSYEVNYANEGVRGAATVSRTKFVVGGELRYAYRISEYVGIHVAMGAPFPTESSYVNSLAHINAGLSFYLR